MGSEGINEVMLWGVEESEGAVAEVPKKPLYGGDNSAET